MLERLSEEDLKKMLVAFRRLLYCKDVLHKEDREVIGIINQLIKDDK